MSALTDIPVRVTPEASAEVDRLGMRAEFDLLLEHARRTIPNLRRLDVTLEPPHDTGTDDSVLIRAWRDRAFFTLEDPVRKQWTEWMITTFSPDVCWHFSFLILYESGHGG